jgi:Na+-translocating ferredoxin:NAD+ oxidoreductase RnfG subunit
MEAIVAILSLFVIAPGIVFLFVYKNQKNKIELKKLEQQKEILKLEIEKQNNHIKLLEEENKKYDRIINA